MNTSRAYKGGDTSLVLWVRNDSGKVTFADGDTIRFYLYPYGSNTKVEESGITPTHAGDTPGRIAVTITEEYADTNLPRGLYRYQVVRNGAQALDGLLEVV